MTTGIKITDHALLTSAVNLFPRLYRAIPLVEQSAASATQLEDPLEELSEDSVAVSVVPLRVSLVA